MPPIIDVTSGFHSKCSPGGLERNGLRADYVTRTIPAAMLAKLLCTLSASRLATVREGHGELPASQFSISAASELPLVITT